MEDAPPRLVEALADKYRLERVLGAGGMATVYLAHDIKHDRSVAVKVLRPELAAVIGAERFLAEIKTTAALQHPHILPLFDSGQADSFLFYVMPLIEGESLRDRLNREHQLPVDDAVRLAKEIGSALDYAHRHGVIHRDIKPENILLHDGSALVADFGIALAVSHAGGNRMTETGLSLGTPSYMSPEQATGERGLDARSDVYSLGALLYEMLAGVPPHTGPTMQAVIAAVVTKEPEQLNVVRRTVPANVNYAVHKALAKLPADRFATADAFVRALSDPTTGALTASTSGFAQAPAPASRSRTIALLAAMLLLAAIAAWGWLRPREHPFINRYAMLLRDNEGIVAGSLGGRVAVSPNGKRIIYMGRGDAGTRLWLKDADKIRPTAITGTDGASSPFFSPDGHQVGFVVNGKSIRILPLDGGSALTLTDSANATAADWGADNYVYFEVDSGISRIRATGGRTEIVYKYPVGEHMTGAEWPVVLPGANGLLFRVRREGQGVADFEIVAMELPKGKPHVLMRGLYARYSASGDLIVVSADGKLLVVPFDAKKLELTGAPVALYEGLESNAYSAAVALSNSGTLIYMTLSQTSARELVWVTREGLASPVDATWIVGGTISSFALSPNGRSIALDVLRAAGTDVWVKQLPGGPFSRITFGDTTASRPSWMPDGVSLLYLLDRGDGSGIPATRRADGVGVQRRLLPSKYANGQALVSPDGKWLIVRSAIGAIGDVGNGDILATHLGDTVLVPLVATPAREVTPALSPDGKFLAYASDESGTSEIFVRPFPDVATARWQLSTSGGSAPIWAHSGKELFFRNGHNDLQVAQVSESPTFTVGAQKPLFSLSPFTFGGPVQQYGIAPDDKRFLMLRETTAGEIGTLIVSEHWFEELKARAQK